MSARGASSTPVKPNNSIMEIDGETRVCFIYFLLKKSTRNAKNIISDTHTISKKYAISTLYNIYHGYILLN